MREDQIRRYSRHILLPDIGGKGQQRLLGASVSVAVGPDRHAEIVALAYLAAAGIGRLVLTGEPHAPVTRADVSGGILYRAADVGRSRLAAIRDRITALNPDVDVVTLPEQSAAALHIEHTAASLPEALAIGGAAAVRMLTQLGRP